MIFPRPSRSGCLACWLLVLAIGSRAAESSAAKGGWSLEKGDLVCRLGDGLWSPLIQGLSRYDKRFSHVGIVVATEGEVMVVHSIPPRGDQPGGVELTSLTVFTKSALKFGAFRLKDPTRRSRLAENALKFVGRPFDDDFDLTDTAQIYCSELVYHSVNETFGTDVVRPTLIAGAPVVTVEDCYPISVFRELEPTHCPPAVRSSQIRHPAIDGRCPASNAGGKRTVSER